MGRLENFIPHLQKFSIEGGGGINIIQFAKKDSIPVESEVVPVLKQINGTLSLREIFLFLSGKEVLFSIDKSLSMLEHLAHVGVLNNADDFFSVLHGSESGRVTHPSGKRMDKSYFSNERLVALIQKTTLFLKCDRSVAETLLKESCIEKIPPETRLIAQGTKDTHFFVLLTGEVGVYRGQEHLASLGSLSVFGESAAIFDKPRNADVITTQESWILKINAANLVDTQSEETFDAFKGLKSRLILNQTLSANPLFRSLPTDVMQFFISKCRIEKYGREQWVVEQGETSGEFFFILQGSVSVIRDGVPVTSLGEGNHFGEVAAMFREGRTASIMTETACTFLVLSQKSLFEVLASHFKLAIDIERTAKRRRHARGNVLEIFEDGYKENEDTNVVNAEDLPHSTISVDEDFIQTTTFNFDLEVVDFSSYGDGDDDDEAAS